LIFEPIVLDQNAPVSVASHPQAVFPRAGVDGLAAH
jgi:hypothetical protein